MSIFNRIFKVGQASMNKVVDKLEKPELMLDQAIRDKEKQIREAKQSVQQCIATERQTKALLEKEKSEQFSWEQKAESAMRSSREDLALKALERAAEHDQKSAALQPNWENQRASVDELKSEIRNMESEIAEFKRNKDFIIAQSKASQVKKDIYEAKARMGKDKTNDLMSRMKAKAERQSFEADAAKEMADLSTGSTSLEDEFKDLGTSASADVQAKLDALKSKLGTTSN